MDSEVTAVDHTAVHWKLAENVDERSRHASPAPPRPPRETTDALLSVAVVMVPQCTRVSGRSAGMPSLFVGGISVSGRTALRRGRGIARLGGVRKVLPRPCAPGTRGRLERATEVTRGVSVAWGARRARGRTVSWVPYKPHGPGPVGGSSGRGEAAKLASAASRVTLCWVPWRLPHPHCPARVNAALHGVWRAQHSAQLPGLRPPGTQQASPQPAVSQVMGDDWLRGQQGTWEQAGDNSE